MSAGFRETETRIEKDALGSLSVPKEAYWGIHTARAVENFGAASILKVPKALISALVLVKKAACLANSELGYLNAGTAKAIVWACDRLASRPDDFDFPVDPLQGGAGTSTHMNVNEVIANLAIEKLGGDKGDYALVDPLEHVNLHQSTNDVYPTALKVAVIFGLRRLSDGIAKFQGALQDREKAFAGIVKVGRTEMQEAVPMTLGAEFSAFAEAIARDRWRTFKCEERLRLVNFGATAIGTGLGAPRKYIFLAVEKLREVTGLGLSRAENSVDQTANADAFVEVSGILKAHAANLAKIADDLRLLHLLGDIRLPALQAGSSIMPGKVNPVLCEAAIQSALKVMANDFLVTEAVSRGTLQINEFLPLIASAMLESLEILTGINGRLPLYVSRIDAREDACRASLEKSETLVTAFLPELGYHRAQALLGEFRGQTELTLVKFLERKLGKETVEKVLSPSNLLSLGYRDDPKRA